MSFDARRKVVFTLRVTNAILLIVTPYQFMAVDISGFGGRIARHHSESDGYFGATLVRVQVRHSTKNPRFGHVADLTSQATYFSAGPSAVISPHDRDNGK